MKNSERSTQELLSTLDEFQNTSSLSNEDKETIYETCSLLQVAFGLLITPLQITVPEAKLILKLYEDGKNSPNSESEEIMYKIFAIFKQLADRNPSIELLPIDEQLIKGKEYMRKYMLYSLFKLLGEIEE